MTDGVQCIRYLPIIRQIFAHYLARGGVLLRSKVVGLVYYP